MQCIKAQSYEHSLDKNAVKKDESQFPLHEYRNLWNNNCQHGRVSEVKFMLECPHCDETCATDAIGGNHMQRWHHPPSHIYATLTCNFPYATLTPYNFSYMHETDFSHFLDHIPLNFQIPDVFRSFDQNCVTSSYILCFTSTHQYPDQKATDKKTST